MGSAARVAAVAARSLLGVVQQSILLMTRSIPAQNIAVVGRGQPRARFVERTLLGVHAETQGRAEACLEA